jgi:group I intron endonuclease
MATIYALTCKVTGSAYVGCSTNMRKRFREHRCALRNGVHNDPLLLEAWRQHGEGAFEMVDLEVLPDDADVPAKRTAELRWIREYEAQHRLYNRNIVSYAVTKEAWLRGRTPEVRERAAAAMRGKKRPGAGAKISATKKALGQRPSREAAIAGNRAALMKRYGWAPE